LIEQAVTSTEIGGISLYVKALDLLEVEGEGVFL
jgi:hypothetical protein